MRVKMDISSSELSQFDFACMAVMRNIGTGTKKATIAACEEILDMSRAQVPKDTWTMLSSAFYEVKRRSDVAGYSYQGIVGYGGNGDPVNPKTGKRASSYMVKLHEDMSAPHVNGKAKFLEDPVREYAEGKFYRTIFQYAAEAIAASNAMNAR